MFRKAKLKEEAKEELPKGRYDSHKENMRITQAQRVAFSNEIGPLPDPVNPDLRNKCKTNLKLFIESYLGGLFENFAYRWAPFHLKAFNRLEKAVIHGGPHFVNGIPRGSAKSAILKSTVLFAMLYGHCEYLVVVCATKELAEAFLESIKNQLRNNERLIQDFPEVGMSIKHIKNKPSKCKGQTLNGKHTNPVWLKNVIQFPTIEGFDGSGARVGCTGIGGSGLRGLVTADEKGHERRVGFVALDDIQTGETAVNPQQVEKNLKIIRKSIMGLRGPGQKFSVGATVTVIEPNDAADQLLSDPYWQGVRDGLLTSLPKNMENWQIYAKIQQESINEGSGKAKENAYYLDNQEAMDEGCEATWPDRKLPDELTSIQHAMNLYFELGHNAFMSEYMNQPENRVNPDGLITLDEKKVKGRCNGFPKNLVPLQCNTITVGCDVQLRVIFYCVVAWVDDFTGFVIDYGIVPRQSSRKINNLENLSRTLQGEAGCDDADIDTAVTYGLNKIREIVLNRVYLREDGYEMRVKRNHIDINWHLCESAVARFCRLTRGTTESVPSRGQGVNNTKKRISAWKKNDGEKHPKEELRRSCEWMITALSRKTQCVEVYHWKAHWIDRLYLALSLPVLSSGSISFYGNSEEEHEMFAKHMCGHWPTEKLLGEEKHIEYTVKENHRVDFLDCILNAMVAASVLEIETKPESLAKFKSTKKVNRKPIEAEEMNVV